MSKKIETPTVQTRQSISLDWAQSYGEIKTLYDLYLNSKGSSDLYHELIEQKIKELLSFWEANRIQAQREFEFLSQILNKIKSSEISSKAQKTLVENDTANSTIPAELGKRSKREDYLDFIKRVEIIKASLKDILKIQDYQSRKAEFKKLTQRKPSLHKAVKLRESGFDFHYDEIQGIQENIRACEIWGQKVRVCLGKYEKEIMADDSQIESSQIGEMTREINGTKEEMNVLIFKDEELENKFVVFDWFFQAKLFLRGQSQSDVKYWKDLLKKAQHKEILESGRYQEICKEVARYQELRGQVKEIEDQQDFLLKPGNNRKDIEVKDRESIERILKELMECKVLTSREEVALQEILNQAKNAMREFHKMKESPTYIPIKKFHPIVKQLQKLPLKIPQEIEEQIMKEERINKLMKRVIGKPSYRVAQGIYKEYRGCSLEIPEAQAISRAYIQVDNMLQKIEDALKNRIDLDSRGICELESQIENSPLELGDRILGITKVKIWLAQVHLIKLFKENKRVPEKPLPPKEISEYLTKGYAIIGKIHNDDQKMLVAWKNSIEFLQGLTQAIEVFFAEISHVEDLLKESNPFSHFIDMEEKVAAILKKASEPSSLLQKRREPSPLVETAATSQQVESGRGTPRCLSSYRISLKRLKTEDGNFEFELVRNPEVTTRVAEEEKNDLMAREEEVRENMLDLLEDLECEKTESDFVQEVRDESGKDMEGITEQYVREIVDSESIELLMIDESVPSKHPSHHPPLKSYDSHQYKPDYPSENFSDNNSIDSPRQRTDYFSNSNHDNDIDIFFNHHTKVEYDEFGDGETARFIQPEGNQKEPFEEDFLGFDVRNNDEKSPWKIKSEPENYDKTIKQIFKTRVSQETYEGIGSFETSKSSDFLFKLSEQRGMQEEPQEKKKKKIWTIIRPEKTERKTRERSQRQSKTPVLFEPEGRKIRKIGKENKLANF